jgi:hypothetical protein
MSGIEPGAGRQHLRKEGGKIVRMGWRSKFVFMLIVYFAGFATAIYCLAPAPEGERRTRGTKSFAAAFESEEFAQSVNSGIHKCVDMGKETALRAAEMIRERIEEAKEKRES